MGMAAILFNGVKSFEQIINTLLTEGPIWNLVRIAPVEDGQIWFLNIFPYKCIGPIEIYGEANLTLP